MRVRLFGTVLSAAAVGSVVLLAVPAGAAAGSAGTDYYGAASNGDLVRVTVTHDKASAPTVIRKGNPETQQLGPVGSDAGVIVGTAADIDAGTTTLFTVSTRTGRVHDLSGLGSTIGSAAIYDSGRRIVYSVRLAHAYAIRSVAATGGSPTTIYRSKTWSPWAVAVTENGRSVFFSASKAVRLAGSSTTTHKSTVWRIDSDGTKQRVEPTVAEPQYYTQLALSPDGSAVGVVRQRLSGRPRAAFSTVSVATNRVTTVLTGYGNPIAGVTWTANGSSMVFRDANTWGRVTTKGVLWSIRGTTKLSSPVLAR